MNWLIIYEGGYRVEENDFSEIGKGKQFEERFR